MLFLHILFRIQITYGTITAPYHGGNGGDPAFFNLGSDEYIVEVEGRADSRFVLFVCLCIYYLFACVHEFEKMFSVNDMESEQSVQTWKKHAWVKPYLKISN